MWECVIVGYATHMGVLCCSVLQCVAVCCSVLQCVTVCMWECVTVGFATHMIKSRPTHEYTHTHSHTWFTTRIRVREHTYTLTHKTHVHMHTHDWVTFHARTRHVTHEWVMSHIWFSHIAQANELIYTHETYGHLKMLYHTHEYAPWQMEKGGITQMYVIRDTCAWITPHTWMSHVPRKVSSFKCVTWLIRACGCVCRWFIHVWATTLIWIFYLYG